MSITDELRKYVGKSKGAFTDHLLAIADRIDAEHERAVFDARHYALYGANERDMAELGWVRKENHRAINTCYVDVVPRIDWELMAQEFEQFAKTVRGMASDAE